jgi:uncharacterized protein
VAAQLALGAPGVLVQPPEPVYALTGVRMDVAAFVGIAARGPARVPVVDERHPGGAAMVEPDRPRSRSVAVAVESWDEYRRVFGAFEGPGRLPWAVAAFFAQGGRRAHVVRIVHDYGDRALDAGGVAGATLEGVTPAARLVARSEGSWGDALGATLRFVTSPLAHLAPRVGDPPDVLRVAPDADVPAGTLLRLTRAAGTVVLRWVEEAFARRTAVGLERHVVLDAAAGADVLTAEVVRGRMELDDGDGRRERFDALGLRADHPRWVAGVLCDESALAWPDHAWAAGRLQPSSDLRTARTKAWTGGRGRWHDLVHEDHFDRGWVAGDEPDTRLTAGVHALLEIPEVALLCVPDLYEPEPFSAPQPLVPSVRAAGAEFARCLESDDAAAPPPSRVPPLGPLTLDPQVPAELERIVALQRDLVDLAAYAGWTALLDVPPGLTQRAALRWRSGLDSAFAAAYHPWLRAHGLGPQPAGPRRIPPSAVAAGIVAAVERRAGIASGPANVLAARIVDVEQLVSPGEHDALHLAGIDVFLLERDGVRLTAARTLSRDPRWRQLAVRRLVTMIALALRAQMAWTVFEPNGAELRSTLRHVLDAFLRELHRRGALAGATPEEGFFVRCDATNNPPGSVDAGRLIADVGIAPVAPIEYVVLRLERADDGTVRMQERGGA